VFLYVKNRFDPEPEYVLTRKMAAEKGVALVRFLDAPFFLLPSAEEGLRGIRSGNYWRKRGREERQWVSMHGEMKFDVLTDTDELQEWLPKVKDLFRARWADEQSSSRWMSDDGFAQYANAMVELAKQDEASLAILYRVDTEELLAFGYNLDKGNTRHIYQHATNVLEDYRKFRLGQFFLIYLFEHSILNGYTFFDFTSLSGRRVCSAPGSYFGERTTQTRLLTGLLSSRLP